MKNQGHSCHAEILSIAYSNTNKITHPDNALKVEWATEKSDALKELQQEIELKPALQVQAKYDAKKNITEIVSPDTSSELGLRKPRPVGRGFLLSPPMQARQAFTKKHTPLCSPLTAHMLSHER